MALTEFLIGRAPDYDPDLDPLAQPLPEEEMESPVHAKMCRKRYIAIRHEQAQMKQALHDMRAAYLEQSDKIRGMLFKATIALATVLAGLLKGEAALEFLKVM